jgi:hypothetical protein
MQTNIENVFRYDRSDPESRQKLDRLIEEFGVSLPELLSETFTQLLDNLVWRNTASALGGEGDVTLQVFLDLGEGDEVPFATIRAGKIGTFSHAELYAQKRESNV